MTRERQGVPFNTDIELDLLARGHQLNGRPLLRFPSVTFELKPLLVLLQAEITHCHSVNSRSLWGKKGWWYVKFCKL